MFSIVPIPVPKSADDACVICGFWRCRCDDSVAFTTMVTEQATARLAQVDRPTEREADLTDRPLPTLARTVELLRIARRTGDRHGVRLFSRMIDRILDAAHTPQPQPQEGAVPEGGADAADVVTLHPAAPAGTSADWTGADYDSYEVLVTVGAADPAARVTRARLPRPRVTESARGWAA